MYCTYLTIYSGNKLPPFYIGKGHIIRINKGYHGSPSSKDYKLIFKNEETNHPELFKTIIITKHNTQKEALEKEYYFQQKLKVINNPLYINKGIWVSHCYCDCTGRKLPDLSIEKMKKSLTGRKMSEEFCQKISKYQKNRPKSEEHKRKIGLSNKGNKRPDLTLYNKNRKLLNAQLNSIDSCTNI